MVDTSGTWTILATSTWNQMQQQFQIYQISAIVMVFVIIGICILFRDAFPFIWARFVTHDVVVGVMNKTTRRIQPNRHFKKQGGMFYYMGEPLPFVKVYPGNFMFAGLPFDILDVDLDVISSPAYRKACNDLREKGYRDINALEKAIQFSQMDKDDLRVLEIIDREGYDNYEDAKKKINPANLTIEDKLVKQFFTSIQLSEIHGYGMSVPSEDILGEVDDVYEARKPSMQAQREIAKMLPICILIFLSAAAVVVIYMVFFKTKV